MVDKDLDDEQSLVVGGKRGGRFFNTDDRLLVIVPHSDDEAFGCGGMIARALAEGCRVKVLLATVGQVEFYHKGVVTEETRVDEFKRSMKTLGVTEYDILFPGKELFLDTIPQKEMIKAFDDQMEYMKSTMVFIPYPSAHQDHRAVFEAGFAACRPSADMTYRRVVAVYEYPYVVHAWQEVHGGGLYIDIEDYIDRKIEALKCHESQIRRENHLFSPETLRMWAEMRGREGGLKYAEYFRILRMVV